VKTVESAAKAVPAAAAQVVAPVQDTVREAPVVASAAIRAQPPANATSAVVGTALSAPTRHPTAPRATRSTHQTSPAATSGVARPPSSGGGASQVSAVPASVPPPVAARPAPAEQGQSAISVPRARHAQQTGVLGAREARIVPSPATTPVPTVPAPIRSAVSIDEQSTPVGTKPAELAGGRPDAPQLPSVPSALGAAASSAAGAGLELPAALLAALLLVAPWLGRLPRPSPGQVRPPLYVSVLERPG
jgi:nicotinate-nucleotide--dimethylbenzimidazole phosphoribosyltransferase